MKTFFLFLFSFLFLSSGILLAQPAEIPYHIEPYELESGFYNGSNQAGNTVEVFSGIVRIDEFPWMQLHFSKANLGRESYIVITSLKDGHLQKLDAVSVEQWNYYSAFFNGDAVEIQLFAAPFDTDIFVNINEITVGDWAGGSPYNSICGPTDDRISSNQPATGRLMNIGCTAWIIPNGKFVSAGHCLDGSGATIMEFQVPPSLPSGTVQHPGPEDQYSVDVSTKIFTNGGVGNDWGVFEVFPNSVTSLMPKEAQGAYWPLVQDLGPDSIRITGYGVDSGVANQTQQTHIGPNWGSSGTTMMYVTDTQGGNSGSPVINGFTGVAVGVHTHGGCNSSGGNNHGTSTFHPDFWTAVDQGAGGCLVEVPSNPTPANGTIGVSINLTELSWTNGAGAITNELYFGSDPGSLSLVQSGILATSWTITGGPFDYSTAYYWQVVEIGDTCNTSGSVWNFTTEADPNIVVDTLFFDDFESGIEQWTVTNNGGNCDWEIFLPTYPNSYTLPATSSGGVLAADSDECGNGTTFLSTATIVPILDLSSSTNEVWIEFDNDWNVIGAQDEAHVEVSTDGGSSWTGIWDQIGTDIRNKHQAIDVTGLLGGQSNVSVRVRSVQPGWDWWWVLDNFSVYGRYSLPGVADPTSFTATAISDSEILLGFGTNPNIDNVVIAWNLTGTFTEPVGPPPTLGQPFAGGTLLYNGTTSPISHSGLNEQTVYYYKAFSYDNVDYSAGIEANDTTFETPIVTDFAVDFLVYDNCANSISLLFGTAPSATECYDPGLDQQAPPPPPTGVFDGRFTACSEDLFIDYKATNTDSTRIWDVHYRPTTGCEPISFSWDPGQLPPEGNFRLIDPHTGGNWVNVDMRTTTNYADALELGYLQIIYNYDVCAGFNLADGWNMISLPLEVSDAHYLSLFPNANPGSLFEYSGGYFSKDTVGTGSGYWLKMPGAEIVNVCGTDITECVIDLDLGWNMIGGPNCSVPLSSVVDPGGIIIPGSLFRYAGGYFTSTSIDATEGYWINANAPGTITVSCGAPLAKNSNDLIIPLETLTDFGKIDISDGINTGETLYFNGKLDEAVSIESYSMPPVPPQGSFDLRLTGGYRLSESDEVTIQVQSSNYPLSVTITDLSYEEGYGYLLQEIVGGVEVGSHRIVDGVEIVIGNENVSLLKITKQEALPTKFALEQNYPNPFNPSTTIKFAVPQESNVNLSVYNVLGELVSTLVNEQKKAGYYEYKFDASNLASGVYLYRLQVVDPESSSGQGFVETKKMVLLR